MGNHDGAMPIRSATVHDAGAIARVHAASWRETYGRFVDDPDTNPWFDVDRRVDMWRSMLADPSTCRGVRVALDDTGVIGFAAVQPTPGPEAARPEELTMLYVLADRPASLWVAADNPRAHAFYHRNGFTPDGAESAFGPIPLTVRLAR